MIISNELDERLIQVKPRQRQLEYLEEGEGDIVRELAEVCRKHDLKFGVYLSPWDQNHESYGTGKSYDDFYVNQFEELLTQYGDIAVVWLDGANGEGSTGKY